MHQDAETQSTPVSKPEAAPEGSGGALIDHVTPFHAWIRGSCTPERSVQFPTVRHRVSEVHETPESTLAIAAGRFGVGTMCHVSPMRISTSEYQ